MAGVYIHIPFCRQACSYCDFHFSTGLSAIPAITEAICLELDKRYHYLQEKQLQSVYFGGGTPSLLQEKYLDKIFNRLSKYFSWNGKTEITIEVNPDDVSVPAIKNWLRTGFNRVSLGLQSFNDEELKWMNRGHTAAQSSDSIKMLQDAGLYNISIDLIYGSRFQNESTWQQTLEKAMALSVPHISAYNLTIENKTRLGVLSRKGVEPPVEEELSSRLFLMLSDFLVTKGYEHYEVSNLALPGYRAVHNSSYWQQQQYLGIGPSAHSFNGKSRQWNVSNNNVYLKEIHGSGNYYHAEHLARKDLYNEYVLTRLRTSWGCDANEISGRFGSEVREHFLKGVESCISFFEKEGDQYCLKRSAWLFADGIASDLFLL